MTFATISLDDLQIFAMTPDNTRNQPQSLDFPTYGLKAKNGEANLRHLTDTGTTIPLNFTTANQYEVSYLKDFFVSKKGMLTPFLVPTFESDFELFSVELDGVHVKGGLAEVYLDSEVWVAWFCGDELVGATKGVSTLVDASIGLYNLVGATTPAGYDLSRLNASVCFKVRFGSDTFEFVPHLTNQTISLTFVEVA
jgi:hypothetical protein